MSSLHDNPAVVTQLRWIQGRIRRTRLRTGLCTASVVALAGAGGLTWLYPACNSLTWWSLLAGLIVLLCLTFSVLIWQPWKRPIALDYLAAQIERRYPRFKGTLLTATQFQGSDAVSPAVLATVEHTADGLWRLEKVDWPINPWPARLAASALVLVLLLIGFSAYPWWCHVRQVPAPVLAGTGSEPAAGPALSRSLESPSAPSRRLADSPPPLTSSQPIPPDSAQNSADAASSPSQPSADGSGKSNPGGAVPAKNQPGADLGPTGTAGTSFAQTHAREIQGLDQALHPSDPQPKSLSEHPALPESEPKANRPHPADENGRKPQPNQATPASPQPTPTESPAPPTPPAGAGHQPSDQADPSRSSPPIRGGGSTSGQRQNVEPEPAPVTTPGSAQVHGAALGRLPENVQALEAQLAAGRVDEKLLRQLNWTSADAEQFVRDFQAAVQTNSLVPQKPDPSTPLKTTRDAAPPTANSQTLRADTRQTTVGSSLNAQRPAATQPISLQARAAEEVNPAYRAQLEAFYRSLAEEVK